MARLEKAEPAPTLAQCHATVRKRLGEFASRLEDVHSPVDLVDAVWAQHRSRLGAIDLGRHLAAAIECYLSETEAEEERDPDTLMEILRNSGSAEAREEASAAMRRALGEE